jgi:hypothetical protein
MSLNRPPSALTYSGASRLSMMIQRVGNFREQDGLNFLQPFWIRSDEFLENIQKPGSCFASAHEFGLWQRRLGEAPIWKIFQTAKRLALIKPVHSQDPMGAGD